MKWKTGKLSAIYATKNIQRTPAKALPTAGQQYRVDYFNWADLASNARGTLRLTNVNNGKYLDTANGLVYFNNDILRAAVSSGLFMFPCNVLYCGYNREIEKLPITASIA